MQLGQPPQAQVLRVHNFIGQRRCKRHLRGREQASPMGHADVIDLKEHGVDAIARGAGHEADDAVREHSRRLDEGK